MLIFVMLLPHTYIIKFLNLLKTLNIKNIGWHRIRDGYISKIIKQEINLVCSIYVLIAVFKCIYSPDTFSLAAASVTNNKNFSISFDLCFLLSRNSCQNKVDWRNPMYYSVFPLYQYYDI